MMLSTKLQLLSETVILLSRVQLRQIYTYVIVRFAKTLIIAPRPELMSCRILRGEAFRVLQD